MILFKYSDLKMPDYNNWNPLAENIYNNIKSNSNTYNYQSIFTVGEVCKKPAQFSFGWRVQINFDNRDLIKLFV